MQKAGKRLLAFLLAFMMVVSLMPAQTQAATKKAAVKKVTLNYTQYVMKKGEKLKLKATVAPKNVKTTLQWKSNNAKVAAVTSKGVVTAKAAKGKATITVTAGKKKATCRITIGMAVKKITASNLNLKVGESAKIKTTLAPGKATVKSLTYKSSNTAVAKVDKKGKVTARKEGTAKITITAADRGKIKKTITVKVTNPQEQPANTQTPAPTPAPVQPDTQATETPGNTQATEMPGNTQATETPENTQATETPEFSMSLAPQEKTLKIGDTIELSVSFSPSDKVTNKNVTWSSSDDTVAAVISGAGKVQALTAGTVTITAASQENPAITASMTVTVSAADVVEKEVTSGEGLSAALESVTDAENAIVTLKTEESEIAIPEGTYENVTLVVDAPKASIENAADFKQVVIRNIAEDTWCEKSGNRIFLDSTVGHIVVDSQGSPNVYLLDGTEAVTVENNGNLKELLIASAAKVLVKGDSVANRVNCEYFGNGRITTYVPLDIYSTTTYRLIVGPGGEQTALKASNESSIPEISGLGTISITIDSTGEHKTVIAENDGTLTDLPKTTVVGRIRKEAPAISDGEAEDDSVIEATVYMVYYSADISNDNVSVYLDGSSTRKAETDDAGNYSFADVPIGNYVVVVEVEGYQLLTQNIYIDNNYNEDRAYTVEDIILMDEAGKAGAIEGVLIDASTGDVVSKGLKVILRKGINNITTSEVASITSDAAGAYRFEDVVPGQYTIQIRDDSEPSEYVSYYENISVQAEATVTKNMTLTKALDSEEMRFVLTWGNEASGASADLDIYLYGPKPFSDTEYDVHFNGEDRSVYGYLMDGQYVWDMASLDVDDKVYEGPETITVKTITEGQYKVFVQDYTNGGTGSQLSASNPVVKVYRGNNLIDTIKMPQQEGGVWFVGAYDNATGKFTVADEVYNGKPNTTTRAKIGTILSRLQQFEIIDAKAFAADKKLLDEVTANYLKKADEETLTGYLEQITALLEKLKAGFVMDKIYVEGEVAYAYEEFQNSHSLASFSIHEEELTGFDVTYKSENLSYDLKQITGNSNYDYRLRLQNSALGVATNYYFDCYKVTERDCWVESIEDPDNTGWRSNLSYERYGYTGGDNSNIGRNLEIGLKDGISLVSMEYAEDAEEGAWTYGDKVDLVLHLQKDATGATRDYKVSYIPLGAELIKITDKNNQITDQYDTSYNSWYEEDIVTNYRVIGENKMMGTTWVPVVSSGATYEISDYESDSSGTGYRPAGIEKVLTVSKSNGAKRVYYIYYYEDTTDAAILGIYDKNNVYTTYSDYNSASTGTDAYYQIQLKGMNSELGKSLEIYTRPGATAKIEYATGSESWDYRSSAAKVTVTAANGKQRIYYIMYSKSDENCNIRSIQSKTNQLKKVYVDGSMIYMLGSEAELGAEDSLELTANAGYTVSYVPGNEETYTSGSITVTETATGAAKKYIISYTQDINGLRLKDVTSAGSEILSVDIASNSSTASQTGEKYYKVALIGDDAVCPTDLQAVVPYGAETAITYASKDWEYSSEYVAKIVVTNNGFSLMYLVTYTQDDSGAVVKGITDKKNPYQYTLINDYLTTLRRTEGRSEAVYCIYVNGADASLGSTYQLELPEGSTVTSRIHKGDEEWKYSDDYTALGYYNEKLQLSVNAEYYYTDRVEVTAKNGAKRIYVIAYAQDETGVMVRGITDEKNTYINTNISSYTSSIDTREADGSEGREAVYLICVKGDNKTLGSTYQLKVAEGSTLTTIHKGESGWNYSEEYIYNSYYDYEAGNYIGNNYYYADRVEVKAASGLTRIYVIAYVQDDSGAVINDITDAENEYPYVYVDNDSILGLPVSSENGNKDTSENVYLIYVKGNNKTLGTTYTLDIPEGASIASTIRKGEEGWNYTGESIYHKSEDYYFQDRVEVTAANGATKVYVIAYVQDVSGAVVTGITDENNTYVYTQIANSPENILLNAKDENGDGVYDKVYRCYIKGSAAALGSTYQLKLPEGSTITSIIHKGDADWDYHAEYYNWGYYDEKTRQWAYDDYYYADRVEVTAANGVTRVYLLAYVQDTSGAVITGITDENNTYSDVSIDKLETQLSLDRDEEEGNSVYDTVYVCYVKGENAALGNTYQLEMPEGTTVSSTLHKGDDGWDYVQEMTSKSYYDSTDNLVKEVYYYTDRVEITAANGVTRAYMIAYLQDSSGTIIEDITDEKNTYSKVQVQKATTGITLDTKNEDGSYKVEEVYLCYVRGANETLGSTYQLQLPEGSVISDTVHKGDDNWEYGNEYKRWNYYDKTTGTTVWDSYYYTDRVEVTAANGTTRVYVIAYASTAATDGE